ncbi:hypothetical protein QBC45DRAFT_335349, partial [Copromyces sp. CBS 386.78]
YSYYINNYYFCIKRFNWGAFQLNNLIFKIYCFYFPKNYYLKLHFIRNFNLKY